ncbi:DUF2497 domain-containing protein [Henriciella pelagia]|jgi:uncharacterized protein|uniref:DUF2497 domain-containing protein n=1 Tax=Henriciella pelagia TaxID=1977912 RepID=A0ABQ1J3Y0_9PROT|nr:DUF2497 domain-containing protein [Henriciella pelagia]GGB58237.1 hypothetical protein GCM10011503_03310 [Henriciella pelagia]
MADKAQAEPTMEEILASIRKIIADDGDTGHGAAKSHPESEPKVAVSVSDESDFDDLSLDDVLEEAEGGGESLSAIPEESFESLSSDEGLLTDVDEEMFDELTAVDDSAPAETAATVDELEEFDFDAVDLDVDEPQFEDALSAPEFEEETVSAPEYIEPESDPAAPPVREPSPLRGKTEAPAAPADPAPASNAGITDERIAGAAASALGKLMVKQSKDAGNPNTLEGLMMEMLRPMLKEWLDANLPAIVERKVEEEVRRIARMAG